MVPSVECADGVVYTDGKMLLTRLLKTPSMSEMALRTITWAPVFKWIRIVFRCWQDRVAYDETRYLRTLATRGSNLTSAFAATQRACEITVDSK